MYDLLYHDISISILPIENKLVKTGKDMRIWYGSFLVDTIS
jgi:hypothetical protein